MKKFMDKDFLLQSETAKTLYHDYAAKVPVLDYHCHINPREIAEDKHFDNITQVWLGGDHYKWRVMRANGATEDKTTGDAPASVSTLACGGNCAECVGETCTKNRMMIEQKLDEAAAKKGDVKAVNKNAFPETAGDKTGSEGGNR